MHFMLDTNICSYIIKNYSERLVTRFKETDIEQFSISSIVLGELWFGVVRSPNRAKIERFIEDFLRFIHVAPYPEKAAFHYGEIRHFLSSHGRLISGNDMLIAAHAMAENATLITNNTKEFSRIPGLKIENWLE
ncbi:MAG: type II toxin-antitoxin system VapC family toxin [Calditrichaeota bacterium]|nr:MAG: type II toxin-antitoxin system VapC family toxin [Calditrichota bacterium]